MSPVKFNDPEVDKRFDALTGKDRVVEIAGVYSGLFSNINRATASKMVRNGTTHLIKAKEGVKDDDVPAPAAGKEKAADKAVIGGK